MCLFYGKRKTWNGRGSAGWDLLAFAGVDVFSAIMYHQIHQTYITATFLSFYVFLSVCSVWSFFLSKQYFNDPFVKLDTVLPKSIFWQGMRGWKKGREHRINKHRRRKGVHFMTDGFQCVCVSLRHLAPHITVTVSSIRVPVILSRHSAQLLIFSLWWDLCLLQVGQSLKLFPLPLKTDTNRDLLIFLEIGRQERLSMKKQMDWDRIREKSFWL